MSNMIVSVTSVNTIVIGLCSNNEFCENYTEKYTCIL